MGKFKLGNKVSKFFAVTLLFTTIVGLGCAFDLSMTDTSKVVKAKEQKINLKIAGAGISTMSAGGALWFKTSYETRTNSPSAVFEVPNEFTKYYVYICQRIVPRDQWTHRDMYIPDTGYTTFNMLKTGQAEVLGSERTYPWLVSKQKFYWLREVDPETQLPYVVYDNGSIGEEIPDQNNTSVIAPAMLVPK